MTVCFVITDLVLKSVLYIVLYISAVLHRTLLDFFFLEFCVLLYSVYTVYSAVQHGSLFDLVVLRSGLTAIAVNEY